MTDFGEGVIERLDINSNLNNPNNPMRKILDYGVGGWLDNFYDNDLAENIFLDSATGKWLDVHGRQLNVPRKLEEEDDKYRNRIVYESMGHLTTNYLKEVYDVELYSYADAFIESDNPLVSNNPHLCNEGFLGIADKDTRDILNKKFLLDKSFYWVYEDGKIDYIINRDDENILFNYYNLYLSQNLDYSFLDNDNIKKVHLTLPNMVRGLSMLQYCSYLTDATLNCLRLTYAKKMFFNCERLVNVNLNCPNLINGELMFPSCPHLENVTMNCPNLVEYTNMFQPDYIRFLSLKYLNMTVSETIKSDFKDYILSCDLPSLQTLIINGEEVGL